jgi:hypothetical protein
MRLRVEIREAQGLTEVLELGWTTDGANVQAFLDDSLESVLVDALQTGKHITMFTKP